MAASFAMSGLAACGQPDGRTKEVPYVRQPERIVPGAPLAYASAALIDGFANGITVTTRNGRPLKIEGNAEHPWSRGGTDVFAQASVLGLYDPFRLQTPQHLGRPSSWQAFRAAMTGRFAALKAAEGGRGLHLVTGPVTSPSLAAQVAAMRRDFRACAGTSRPRSGATRSTRARAAPMAGRWRPAGASTGAGRRLARWRRARSRARPGRAGAGLDRGAPQGRRRGAAADPPPCRPEPEPDLGQGRCPLVLGSDGLDALIRDLLAEAGAARLKHRAARPPRGAKTPSRR